jgi:septal ring factor EnvC (AmiA/AmiB activator)
MEVDALIYTLVITEAVAFIIVLIKTLPVLNNKVQQLEGERQDLVKKIDGIKSDIHKHDVQLAEAKKERDSIKHEFEENKETMKEIHRDLKRAVEDNTKAIISLEATLKHIIESR